MEWELIGCICFVVAMVQMFTMYILNIYDLNVHIYILVLPILITIVLKVLNWVVDRKPLDQCPKCNTFYGLDGEKR